MKLNLAVIMGIGFAAFNAAASTAEFKCLPAAYDIFFGSPPSYVLFTLEDKAVFGPEKNAKSSQIFAGKWVEVPAPELVRENMILYSAKDESKLYVDTSLIEKGTGDVLAVGRPLKGGEKPPAHYRSMVRYQCTNAIQ